LRIEEVTMKRLLGLSLALLLVLAACGDLDMEPTANPTATEQEAGSDSTPTVQVQPGSTIDVVALLDFSGQASNEPADGSDPSASPTSEAMPADGATPTTPIIEITQTHEDLEIEYFPHFVSLPEIVSCEQAVDLWLETLQIWLNGLDIVPVEVIEEGTRPPRGFERFTDQMGERMIAIEEQALQLGCVTDELELAALARIASLVANNSTAEYVLVLLRAEAEANHVESTATPEATEVEVEWTIARCVDAAEVFIDRTQVLLLDTLAGMTVAELEAIEDDEDAPEPILRFMGEFELIHMKFLEISCSEEEVTALVGERVDRLVPQGEAAEEVVRSLREAIAEGELFSGID
jgi:hypothetical protein